MDDAIGPLVVGSIFGVIIGVFAGIEIGQHSMRLNAVECGVAEFVLDPKTGGSEWRWKR